MATEDKKKADPRSCWLKRVRLSFSESLHEAEATVEGGDPKHTCNVILESDSATFEANKAATMRCIRAAGEETWKDPEAWKGIAEDAPKRVSFRKGERFKNREGVVYQGYAGNYAISAAGPKRGSKRPILLDRHKRDVEIKDIPDVFYGGVYGDVKVSWYGTDKGGRGIFATIEAIRSHQEGERMGGGGGVTRDEIDELDDLDDGLDQIVTGGGSSASDDDLL